MSYQRHAMKLVEPGLRERLLERHRQIGPLSQYHDLKAIDAVDVRDRLATLKPKLLLLRGVDDPTNPPEYEKEVSRRRARLAIREALRGGALSAHRDSRQGQRADRRVRRRAVRELTSPCTS